ncbi:hypothetical protein ACFV06_36030 [Streptomyces sp. NPDC059618]|uniref:hypothetical protein n=1 Tax=Streptomyces sp. NPDC059618 TaxID=3346887 RepID=UPI003686B330
MRCSVTALLAAAGLALAGSSCLGGDSGSGGPAAAPKPSAATAERAHQACVTAWAGAMSAADYDPGEGFESPPGACDRLPDRLKMFTEAELEHATRDRTAMDACAATPDCTPWQPPTP